MFLESCETELPSFMLIKDMPNCIEGIFGMLINRKTVMDEVAHALRGSNGYKRIHQHLQCVAAVSMCTGLREEGGRYKCR